MRNMGNILKQAQEMQGRMVKLQEELAATTIAGQAGGGMVEITVNGRNEVVKVRIDPAAVDPDDVDMLEDLVQAAANDAQKRMMELTQQRMSQVTGGLNIPGLGL